jgi:hypothetical protein
MPVPRQQFVEPECGMSRDHALEHVLEIGVGLDAIEFGIAPVDVELGRSALPALSL